MVIASNKPTHRKHHPLHDYRSVCIYHITLVVSDRVPLFGRMVGDNVDEARVEFTPLGLAVCHAIQAIPGHETAKGNDVQILQSAVMPDHVHFIIHVRQPMRDKLGYVIRGFKQGCNKELRRWLEISGHEMPAKTNGDGGHEMRTKTDGDGGHEMRTKTDGDGGHEMRTKTDGDGSPSGQGCIPCGPMGQAFVRQLQSVLSARILHDHALFEKDFDETRLRRKGQLRAMIDYVHNNPRHRWLKSHHPNLLAVTRGIMIAGKSYDAIGNVNLLGLPRQQVHCRYGWERSHDIEARRAHQNDCVVKARHGYVLVSPFISPYEAAVRDVCLQEGHSIIQLVDNGFTEYSQCPGGLYDWCVNGQVLVLVPSEYPHIDRKGDITRLECNTLNERAEEIVNE